MKNCQRLVNIGIGFLLLIVAISLVGIPVSRNICLVKPFSQSCCPVEETCQCEKGWEVKSILDSVDLSTLNVTEKVSQLLSSIKNIYGNSSSIALLPPSKFYRYQPTFYTSNYPFQEKLSVWIL